MTLMQIVFLLGWIESERVNIKKHGPDGELGVWQITPVARKQVNKTFGTHFEEEHMTKTSYARNCALLYLVYLKVHYEDRHKDPMTVQYLVRNYIGGEYGYLKLSTKEHWEKFKVAAGRQDIKLKKEIKNGNF